MPVPNKLHGSRSSCRSYHGSCTATVAARPQPQPIPLTCEGLSCSEGWPRQLHTPTPGLVMQTASPPDWPITALTNRSPRGTSARLLTLSRLLPQCCCWWQFGLSRHQLNEVFTACNDGIWSPKPLLRICWGLGCQRWHRKPSHARHGYCLQSCRRNHADTDIFADPCKYLRLVCQGLQCRSCAAQTAAMSSGLQGRSTCSQCPHRWVCTYSRHAQ